MPNQTTNYKLTKPLASELYDINVQNGNMDVIDETLKDIETEASRHPVANLLDNSDFRNPVNQRGNGSTIGDWKPCIDRWRATTVDARPVWHDSDHIAIYQGCNIVQGIEAYKLKIGKEYTLACKIKDGEVCVVSGSVASNDGYAMQYSANGVGMQLYGVNDGYWYVKVLGQKTNANVKLEWIALYEGAYTADTLPAYQPKGFAAELAECQRYYENSWWPGNTHQQNQMQGFVASSNIDAYVSFKQSKRITPTITLHPYNPDTYTNWTYFNGSSKDAATMTSIMRCGINGFMARLTAASGDTVTKGYSYAVDGHWEASTDL